MTDTNLPPSDDGAPFQPFDFDPTRYALISYPKGADAGLLAALVRRLLRRGVSVWMYNPTPCGFTDDELRAIQRQKATDVFETDVLDMVGGAACAVLLFSKATSSYQLQEVTRAISSGRFVVGVLDDMPLHDLPPGVRGKMVNYLDVTKKPPEEIAAQVKALASDIADIVVGAPPKAVTHKPKPKPAPVAKKGGFSAGPYLAALAALVVVGAGGYFSMPYWPDSMKSILPGSSGTKGAGVETPAAPSVPTVAAIPSTAGPRLALVIHQTSYKNGLSRIEKAESEAGQIAGALKQVGFEVTTAADLNKAGLETTIADFRRKLELSGENVVGFVYYTGHGAQHPSSHASYLLGIDTDIQVGSDLAAFGVNLNDVSNAFSQVPAKGIFLVFDACRNTPPPGGTKTTSKGLFRVDVSGQLLVAYSTDLGSTAEEGAYAPILAEELVRGGQTAEDVFTRTKNRVAANTKQAQKPWNESKIYNEELCFGACPVR